MMNEPLSAEVLMAVSRAQRTQGWNFRPDGVQKFAISPRGCELYVVPTRFWVYRRLLKRARAAAWRPAHGDTAA